MTNTLTSDRLVHRLDVFTDDMRALLDRAEAFGVELRRNARSEGTSYWSAVSRFQSIIHRLRECTEQAHRAGTDCAVDIAVQTLGADAGDEAYELTIDAVVRSRGGK